MQSIISVNTNILLRRFRLKFLRIMYSTSCYKEHLNFENTLYSLLSLHNDLNLFRFICLVVVLKLWNKIFENGRQSVFSHKLLFL
jgi:hypothetical protein